MEALKRLELYNKLQDIGIEDKTTQDKIIEIILPYMQRQEDEIFDIEN